MKSRVSSCPIFDSHAAVASNSSHHRVSTPSSLICIVPAAPPASPAATNPAPTCTSLASDATPRSARAAACCSIRCGRPADTASTAASMAAGPVRIRHSAAAAGGSGRGSSCCRPWPAQSRCSLDRRSLILPRPPSSPSVACTTRCPGRGRRLRRWGR